MTETAVPVDDWAEIAIAADGAVIVTHLRGPAVAIGLAAAKPTARPGSGTVLQEGRAVVLLGLGSASVSAWARAGEVAAVEVTAVQTAAGVTVLTTRGADNAAPAAAVIGAAANQALTAGAPMTPLDLSGLVMPEGATFSVGRDGLPGGLVVSAAGVVSGTPSTPQGLNKASVQADFGGGTRLEIPLLVSVAAA